MAKRRVERPMDGVEIERGPRSVGFELFRIAATAVAVALWFAVATVDGGVVRGLLGVVASLVTLYVVVLWTFMALSERLILAVLRRLD